MHLKNLPKKSVSKKEIAKAPENSGIYVFWQGNKPLYIGKAVNLRNRLRSYLGKEVFGKTSEMLKNADYFSYLRVSSELESLLLEAKLIRSLKPPYNSALKDDKNPLYLRITDDEFPQVLTARRIEDEKENL